MFRPNYGRGLRRRRRGLGAYPQMTKLVIDVVLFSCMLTFVTGIVLAATHFF